MIMKEMQLISKILQDKFCNHKQCIVLHEKQEFEHLFSEIYCVPEQIKSKRQTMRQSLKSTPPIIGDVASCIRPEDYLTMA